MALASDAFDESVWQRFCNQIETYLEEHCVVPDRWRDTELDRLNYLCRGHFRSAG